MITCGNPGTESGPAPQLGQDKQVMILVRKRARVLGQHDRRVPRSPHRNPVFRRPPDEVNARRVLADGSVVRLAVERQKRMDPLG